MLFDIPETFAKQWWHLRAVPAQYPYLIGALLGIAAIGFISANRKVHAVLSVTWLPALLGYEFLSALGRIVGRL